VTARHVAIVGGGAAGCLLALALLRRSPDVHVTVVDRRAAFGRGVAYGAAAAHHRINVPAFKMGGLFPDDDDGFVRWLAEVGRPTEPFDASFVPRAWFGDYLVAQVAVAEAGGRLVLRTGEVTSLERNAAGWRSEGPDLAVDADDVVLCPGNPPPRRVDPTADGERLVPDVWGPRALDGVTAEASVLVLGTGATAIDAVLDLAERGHRGPVTMVSRRGLLPLVDVPSLPYPDFFDPALASQGLRAVVRRLREEVRDGVARGAAWQHVVDAFRVHAGAIWLRLGDTDRRRFLRHARAPWMVHRHRLAPDIDTRLDAWRRDGRLTVVAARVRATQVTPDGCAVTVQQAGGPPAVLRADWVLNCIGPSEDFSRLGDPLWTGLFANGVVRPGPFGLGLDVDASLRLRDRDGRAHGDLFTLGLPTRGAFWEVTAVTHIRQQAAELAAHLFP
jgi:uncharacterized NAD(P)/FAD-binding protein YdhS